MDIRAVDLNLLVVLEALLRLQSVSRTAKELKVSQPAVSYALARLRKLLDDPLLVRSGNGLQSTPRALELVAPLHAVLDSIRHEILQASSFDPATAQRTVTLALTDVGELVFLPALGRFLHEHARGIAVRSIAPPADGLERALQSGEIDVAIGYFPQLKGSAVYQQRLFDHRFVCVVRAGHPLAQNRISRRAFEEARHAVVEGYSNDVFAQALQAQQVRRTVALRMSHYLAIPHIVVGSDLIVTVPYAVGASLARMGGLKALRPPIDARTPTVRQHWHARLHNDPVGRWLRGVIAELFVEAPPKAARGRTGS